MKNIYLMRTLLLIVTLLSTFSSSYAQRGDNWDITTQTYIKTAKQLSCKNIQNGTKINQTTYLLSKDEATVLFPDDILYISPIWYNKQSQEKYAIDNSVILYDATNITQLANHYHISNNIIALDSITGKPIIYIMYLRNMTYEQIDSLCAVMNGSQYCKIAEPNYVVFNSQQNDISPDPTYNEYYWSQWGLNSTSSPQYDINARDAWRITTGTNIKVAIIDTGFELNHPDLVNNIYSSYDCTDGADGALNGAYGLYADNHGTMCAGIIGATNNNIGIIGVAPNSQLILMRDTYSINDSTRISYSSWTINALRLAYQLGADVISNSWSINALSNNYSTYDAVLYEAYTLGRSGKGCAIIFSTGNQAKTFINYPSNSPYTISVGASNTIGRRESWSNHGLNLDVVAPGLNIRTTQIIPCGSYDYMTGTSAAAPMVAGVAALVLSVNQNLTSTQVGNIIRTTAYKLPYYSFDSIAPCGAWNQEVGYGLVDAAAAVWAAMNTHIQGPDTLCDMENYHVQNLPPSASVRWSYETTIQQVDTFPILHLSDTTTASISVERGTYFLWGFDGLPLPDEPYVGYVTLKAAVTFNGTTRTFSKLINLREDKVPTLPASSLRDLQLNETRTFSINNCPNVSYYDLIWEITLPQSTTPFTHHGSIWTTTATQAGTLNIILYNAENCNDTLHSEYNILVSKLKPFDPFPPDFIFPNPVTTNTVEIQVVDQSYVTRGSNETAEERPAIDYTLELWDENYGLLKTVNSSISGEKDIVTLDLSNLRNGVYFLVLKVDKEILSTSKMIINK